MSQNLGPKVSRWLAPECRQWDKVVFQAGKPVLDSELNLMQDNASNESRRRMGLSCMSGVYMGADSAHGQMHVYPTRGLSYDSEGKPFYIDRANEFAIDPFVVLGNGMVIPVDSSSVNVGQLEGRFVSVSLFAPPQTGKRLDLVFLEFWMTLIDGESLSEAKPAVDKVFFEGNRQFKDNSYDLLHGIIDPAGRIETTKRVQIQSRLRVFEGVDLGAFPDGLGDPQIMGWGTVYDNCRSTFPLVHMWGVNQDFGLYRAGDGGADCQNLLGTVDGYTYAVPLFAINRRNSGAYNVHTNPNGSLGSIANTVVSDRPDCLLHDEIADRDVIPLYHFVNPSGLNFAELGSDAFDKLVRGDLSVLAGSDYYMSTWGNILMGVDGISYADQQGVYKIAAPDGVRSVFSDSACDVVVRDSFPDTVDYSGTVVSFVRSCYRVALQAPSEPVGTVISSDTPTMVWQDNGNTVAVLAPWTGLGTANASVELDEEDVNFEVDGVVVVTFTLNYAKGAGLRFAPVALHKFRNEQTCGLFDEYGFGYVGECCPRPICACRDIDLSIEHWVDYTPCDFNNLPRREVRGSFSGNGTDTIVIGVDTPCEVWNGDWVRIAGCEPGEFPYRLVGFGEFRLVSTSSEPVMPTVQIVRAGENFYELKFCRSITVDEVIGYRAYCVARVGGFDSNCRGLAYVAEPIHKELPVATPSGGFVTYTFSHTRPIAQNLVKMPFGVNAEVHAFLWVYGAATPINCVTWIDDFTVEIKVREEDHPLSTPSTSLTACPCISNLAEVYLFERVAPTVSDKWQIYYDYRPYQGLGKTPQSYYDAALQPWRHQFVIKADGEIIVNSRGSGVGKCACGGQIPDGCTLFPVVSEMLPLPFESDDSDLQYSPVKITNAPNCSDDDLTFFGMFHNFQQVKRGVALCTKDFRAGNIFAMMSSDVVLEAQPESNPCICDEPVPPVCPEVKRGIPGYSLVYGRDRFKFLTDGFFGWRMPSLSEAATYQGIWYSTVVDRHTGECYLLVLTKYFDADTGCGYIHSKLSDPKVAFDLFRLPGRPLAPVFPVAASVQVSVGSAVPAPTFVCGSGSGEYGPGFVVLC